MPDDSLFRAMNVLAGKYYGKFMVMKIKQHCFSQNNFAYCTIRIVLDVS